ncbi:MAG: SCO1664 family protein [Chloroflexota bacterium]
MDDQEADGAVELAIPAEPASLELLRTGELTIVGRLMEASNASFLCRVTDDAPFDADEWPEDEPPPGPLCVYKPIKGERALYDFPDGTLARREVAAFLVSEATGWSIVPPTVLRDGPFGEGAVQAWMQTDPGVDVVELVVGADPRLRPMCVFDAIANNADRKGGHILPLTDGTLRGVDHGICFNLEPKLRTILWQWAGVELSEDELAVVGRVAAGLSGDLGLALGEMLTRREIRATARRAAALLESGRFPEPDPGRPALPWPPF